LFGESPDFVGLLARHERIHRFARAAKSLFDAGDVEKAMHQGELLDLENRSLMRELLVLIKQREYDFTED
ncbi:hypothetical protein HAP98_12115, partial [Acidithiobacillus caldus]